MDKNNFVVTIGRQFGSGGRILGKTVAKKLGIDYYDKELLFEYSRKCIATMYCGYAFILLVQKYNILLRKF